MRVTLLRVASGGAELASLVGGVERALAALGFPAEERPFHGHLTIGRVRSPRGGGPLAKAIAAAGVPRLGSWTVPEVILYESRLRPQGALHVPVTRHPLRGERG